MKKGQRAVKVLLRNKVNYNNEIHETTCLNNIQQIYIAFPIF